MRSSRLIATAALTVSLLGAGVARADAPWSAPVPIASGADVFWRPALNFTGDGHAVATLDGTGSTGLVRVLAAEPGASTFTEIGRPVLLAAPAPYGRRGVAYLRTPPLAPGQSIDDGKVTRLGVSLGRVPGSLGRFQPLARLSVGPRDVAARIAADGRGCVAAAGLEPRRGRTILRVALRRPGHAFGRATTLGDATTFGDDSPPLDLAYGANGDLVVAFQRSQAKLVDHSKLHLAVRVARGGRFGPIQSLGPLRGFSSIATAVAPTGRAVVAWGTQDGGEGVEEPWTVRAAVLRSSARRFSKTQLLDPGQVARPVGPVRAAIGREGTATVAWSGISRTKGPLPYPVRVATARPTGRFGPTAQLAPSGVALGVVTARDGTTTVLWGPLTDPEGEVLDRILASRRPTGASVFAAPEAVSENETATHNAAIALNPRSGRPAALWVGAPGSLPGQPLDGVPVELRYSTRGG